MPVAISRNAFIFCRYVVTIILLVAFVLRIELLVLVVFLLLIMSAFAGVKRAPLILLYTYFEKILKHEARIEIVDVNAMRFAHILGSMFAGLCVLLFLVNSMYVWSVVFLFLVIKIISAIGFCPASKLYTCSTGGNCCRFLKHK